MNRKVKPLKTVSIFDRNSAQYQKL